MKALVIDDSRAMRTIIGRILRSIGFETLEAANGKEALVCLDSGNSARPGHGGLEHARRDERAGVRIPRPVRGRSEFNDIRLMMVTTETEMNRMAEALAQGANEYVMKTVPRRRSFSRSLSKCRFPSFEIPRNDLEKVVQSRSAAG